MLVGNPRPLTVVGPQIACFAKHTAFIQQGNDDLDLSCSCNTQYVNACECQQNLGDHVVDVWPSCAYWVYCNVFGQRLCVVYIF